MIDAFWLMIFFLVLALLFLLFAIYTQRRRENRRKKISQQPIYVESDWLKDMIVKTYEDWREGRITTEMRDNLIGTYRKVDEYNG